MGIQRKHTSASNYSKKYKSSNDANVVIFDLWITIKDDYLSTAWRAGNLPVKSIAYFMERNIYIQAFTH